MNTPQNQINNTVNGSNNTIIQYQNNMDNHTTVAKYSEQYAAKDYCSRKKTFNLLTRFLFSLIGFIADILSIVQVCIPLFIKSIKSIGENSFFPYFFLFAIFSFFTVILTALIKHEFFVITRVHQNGIYQNIYISDYLYKLYPNKCPICGAKVIIKNSSGTIIFKCTHSDNHSKKIDISELNNLPFCN